MRDSQALQQGLPSDAMAAAASAEASAVDLAFAGEEAGAGGRRRKDISQMSAGAVDANINKINYDTLKLSSHELDGIRDAEGFTARMRLAERLEQHAENPDEYPMGKKYYNTIRMTFRSEDSPLKKLMNVGKTLQDTINPDMIKAMREYKCTGNRDAMLNYLDLCPSLNRSEFVGVATFALELNPTTSVDHLKACCRVVSALNRLQVLEAYPGEFYLLREWLDAVVIKVHKGKKGEAAWPKAFCTSNRDMVTCVIPAGPLDRVLAHDGEWKDVEDELLTCTASGLGKRLFGGCLSSIVNENVERGIMEGTRASDSSLNNHAVGVSTSMVRLGRIMPSASSNGRRRVSFPPLPPKLFIIETLNQSSTQELKHV